MLSRLAGPFTCPEFSAVWETLWDTQTASDQEESMTTDPIERAKRHARALRPGVVVATRSVRGRPVVLAQAGNVIQFVRPEDVPDRDTPAPARLQRYPYSATTRACTARARAQHPSFFFSLIDAHTCTR